MTALSPTITTTEMLVSRLLRLNSWGAMNHFICPPPLFTFKNETNDPFKHPTYDNLRSTNKQAVGHGGLKGCLKRNVTSRSRWSHDESCWDPSGFMAWYVLAKYPRFQFDMENEHLQSRLKLFYFWHYFLYLTVLNKSCIFNSQYVSGGWRICSFAC